MSHAILMDAGRWREALDALDASIAGAAPTPELLAARGKILFELRLTAESLECFERALVARPMLDSARLGRARALLRLGRMTEALAVLHAVLAQHPEHAAAHAVLGAIALAQGRIDEAGRAAARSRAIDPHEPIALVVDGHVLLERGDHPGALTALDAALRANPLLAAAHQARGRTLVSLHRPADAIDAYDAAARWDPNNSGPSVEAAFLKIRMHDFAGAALRFAQALAREPEHVDALRGLAQCLFAANRTVEAIEAYRRLLDVAPDADYMRGECFHAQLHCCDWRQYEAMCKDLTERVRRGERADIPGSFMVYSESPADQLLCARTYVADVCVGAVPPAEARITAACGDRIRIAYVSADLHAHATAYLAAGLFEAHDRARFETFAVSFGPDDGSAMRARLERAFDHFLDVRHCTDAQIAASIRQWGVEIAVDLKGHTLGARPGVFAQRCAPVQVSFLGYPGTLGAGFMDYIVADRFVIPESSRAHYAEQVIYLPHCYQVNDSGRIAGPVPTRREVGLPESGFVFGCFNASYKVTPRMFAVWMQILANVPHSILWLIEGCAAAVDNLRREADCHGIDAARLIFAPWRGASEHLARCSLADLCLDTLPTNAHTGASDALWAGVPLVTMAGATFTSRVATSLLHAVGLGELSVASLDDYQRLAVHIACSPDEHAALKTRLAGARRDSPLFDSQAYCGQLEAAYTQIVERKRRGEAPGPVRLGGV